MLFLIISYNKITDRTSYPVRDDLYKISFRGLDTKHYDLGVTKSHCFYGSGYFLLKNYENNKPEDDFYLNGDRILSKGMNALVVYLYDGYNHSDMALLVYKKIKENNQSWNMYSIEVRHPAVVLLGPSIERHTNIISKVIVKKEDLDKQKEYEILKKLFIEYSIYIKKSLVSKNKVLIMFRKNTASFYAQTGGYKNSLYENFIPYLDKKYYNYQIQLEKFSNLFHSIRIYYNQSNIKKNMFFITNVVKENKINKIKEIWKRRQNYYSLLSPVIMYMKADKIKKIKTNYIFILYLNMFLGASGAVILVDSNLEYESIYYTLICLFKYETILILKYKGHGIYFYTKEVSGRKINRNYIFFMFPGLFYVIKSNLYIENMVFHSFSEVGYYKNVEDGSYELYLDKLVHQGALYRDISFDMTKLLEDPNYTNYYKEKKESYKLESYKAQNYLLSVSSVIVYYVYYILKQIYLSRNNTNFYIHESAYDFESKLENDLSEIEAFLKIENIGGIHEIDDSFYYLSQDNVVKNINMIYEDFFNTALLIFFTGKLEYKNIHFCSVIGKLDDVKKIYDGIVSRKIRTISYKATCPFVYECYGQINCTHNVLFV